MTQRDQELGDWRREIRSRVHLWGGPLVAVLSLGWPTAAFADDSCQSGGAGVPTLSQWGLFAAAATIAFLGYRGIVSQQQLDTAPTGFARLLRRNRISVSLLIILSLFAVSTRRTLAADVPSSERWRQDVQAFVFSGELNQLRSQYMALLKVPSVERALQRMNASIEIEGLLAERPATTLAILKNGAVARSGPLLDGQATRATYDFLASAAFTDAARVVAEIPLSALRAPSDRSVSLGWLSDAGAWLGRRVADVGVAVASGVAGVTVGAACAAVAPPATVPAGVIIAVGGVAVGINYVVRGVMNDPFPRPS